MSGPRILHVFSTFAPGGPQVRTVGLIGAMGDAFDHVVLPMDGVADAADLLPDGSVGLMEPPRGGGPLGSVRTLRARIAEAEPALVCTYNWGAIEGVVAARSRGVPVLHHEDGFLPDEAKRFKRRRVLARRLVLPGAEAVIVPSHRLFGIATEQWKLAPEHVRLVPNGIHVETFGPGLDAGTRAARRAELGLPAEATGDSGAFVIGGVGHLRREKNPVRLVEALAAMEAPHARLLLLGDGPERGAVEAAIAGFGLDERVILAGHRDDPRADYAAMDAFAIPSDTEQMPVALLEAMASELPVASTDVGDCLRMLPPEQGQLVVPLDAGAAALGAALDRLAADPDLRATLGAANRARVVERYSFDAMLEAYRGAYEEAMKRT